MNTKNKFIIGVLLVLFLIGLPVVIYLSQKKQETRSHASASTTLSFSPSTNPQAPLQKNIGSNVSLDVFVAPGTNRPSIIKLELDYDPAILAPTSSPFVVNTAAFPETREGPFVQNGKILISVSVGSDPSKAISQVTRVGTVNFTARAVTSGPVSVDYGDTTQVLSVASTDQANENVLSTTTPAYITVLAAPTPTPTPTPIPPTPTPTPVNRAPTITITSPQNGAFFNVYNVPVTVNATDSDGSVTKVDYYLNNALFSTSTNSPYSTNILLPHTDSCRVNSGTIKAVATDNKGATSFSTITITWNDGCPPTPTPTPIAPTPTPSPTPTPLPSAADLTFNIQMHGIGSSGDNANPDLSSLSNKFPVHQTRDLQIEVYDSQNRQIETKTGNIYFDDLDGDFKGTFSLNNFPSSGIYTIKVKSSSHLRKIIPGIQNIIIGENNSTPQVALIAGDANNDNSIDILDYNMLIGCYSDLAPATSCTETQKVATDLDDDGNVNQTDYNLFLREINVQVGQ